MLQKNKFLIWISLIILTFSANAQTTEQMRKWAFNGVEVDFTGATVSTQTISSPVSGADGAYASYYDENDQLVVRVVDNTVYDEDNNIVGPLFDDPEGDDLLTDQIIIAPQEQYNSCSFDIFYAVSVDNRDHIELRRAIYNKGTNQISETQLIHEWHSSYTKASITVSDFIGSTNERRLYMTLTTGNGSKLADTTKIALFKGPGWRNTPVDVIYHAASTIGELELSSDLSVLVYTKPFAHAYNHGQLMLIKLDANGYFEGPEPYIHYDIDPTFSKHFAGLELSDDNNYAYVNSMGDRTYRIDVSDLNNIQNAGDFQFNTGDEDYSYSQIERAHTGDFYMVKPNGDLGYFDANYFNSGMQFEDNIGSSAVINNAMHSNDPVSSLAFDFYVIPDQMDGCEYDYITGNDVVCCYESFDPTPPNSGMNGVTIDESGSGRDIIIESGYSVTWTATSNSFGNVEEAYMGNGNIIIEEGASLTIEDMTIHFREDYGMYLYSNYPKIGSRLEINNTKLTAHDVCEDNILWKGVVLDGDLVSSQIPTSTTSQPYLYMGSSTIEFAELGVHAAEGGLLKAYNSEFINNKVGVTINNHDPQYSLLKNCVFEWDNGIYDTGSIYAIAQLYLWDASGVTVKGCDFLNNADDDISISYRGIGILADYFTDFNVSGRCTDPFCSNYDRNTFSKLKYGIISNGGNDVLIDRCDFIDNYGSARIIASESLQFTRNNLNVYDYDEEPSLDYESFGLYLEGCTGYQVEENDFHDGLLGIVVYNSGQYTNEIYLNDFYNLNGNGVATGAIGIGINSGTRSPSGLHFNCNDFNQTDYAIAVTGGHLVTADDGFIYVSSSSISSVQGRSLITGTYTSADNTFWLHGMSDQNDFYVDENISLYDQYRYNGAYDNLTDRDANINSFDNNLVSKHYYGTFSTRENECPSNLDGGGGVIPIPLMVQNLNEKEEEIFTLEQEYSDLTSGVNVNELTHLSNISTSNNTQGVHNALISASPYLTDTILNTYLMNENANEISRANVMLANSPLPSNVQENIDKSNLSTDIKHYIMAHQVGVNVLEKIETDIQSAKASKQFITDRLHLKYMHSDSTVLIQEWENMLETKNDIHSKEKLLNVYFSKGEFDAAENLLANLETELSFSNNSEKLRQIKVKQIELSMRQNGSDHDLNQSDLNYLYTIADDYNTKAGGQARSLLMAAGVEEYDPVIILPNPNNQKSAMAGNAPEQEDLSRDEDIELSTRFNIYPNPATDILSVEFITSEEACTFVIYDIQGRQIRSIEKEESLGYLTIDVSDLESGSYIIYSPQLGDRKQFVVKH